MATVTIRRLDDEVKRRLRIRAAEHGRSMEEEAPTILSEALGRIEEKRGQTFAQAVRRFVEPMGGIDLDIPPRDESLAVAIHKRFAPLGGVDLDIPPRGKTGRGPPSS